MGIFLGWSSFHQIPIHKVTYYSYSSWFKEYIWLVLDALACSLEQVLYKYIRSKIISILSFINFNFSNECKRQTNMYLNKRTVEIRLIR